MMNRFFMSTNLSDAQDWNVRLPNDPIAVPVVPLGFNDRRFHQSNGSRPNGSLLALRKLTGSASQEESRRLLRSQPMKIRQCAATWFGQGPRPLRRWREELGPVNTMSFSHEMCSSDRPIGYSAPRAAFWWARMPANWAAAELSRGSGDPPYYLRHTYN
jgi:hypothetical protein